MNKFKEIIEDVKLVCEELKGYREEHGDYSHQIKDDVLYNVLEFLEINN